MSGTLCSGFKIMYMLYLFLGFFNSDMGMKSSSACSSLLPYLSEIAMSESLKGFFFSLSLKQHVFRRHCKVVVWILRSRLDSVDHLRLVVVGSHVEL